MKFGNWADEPCYYVSVIDGPRKNLLLGPYRTHKEALSMVEPVRKKGEELDPRAVFYAFGTCKAPNGYREGSLNRYFQDAAGKLPKNRG